MKKSGLADSPFFYLPPAPEKAAATPLAPKHKGEIKQRAVAARPKDQERKALTPKSVKAAPTRSKSHTTKHDTVIPRHHDTMVSRYHGTTVQRIRAAVKQIGKEAATHRFTPAEKKAVADIIYTYKLQGIRTSENELARIAIHALIEDYRANGESSTLDKVLEALNE